MQSFGQTSGGSPTSSTGGVLVQATTAVATAFTAWGIYTYLTYDHRWWWKRRSRSPLEVARRPNWESELIHGTVAPGWETVRNEFVHNFRSRGELGAAICIYYRGKKVVDLWGGYKDRQNQRPWEEDTMVPIFSSSKGISAFAILMQESRGKIDTNEKVSKYWPEFSQNGKQDLTVAQLIDHSAGLAGISPPITLEMLQHPDTKRVVRGHLAKAAMDWPNAGDYKGYMAVNLGFFESDLVQLTDTPEDSTDASGSPSGSDSKSGRSIGQYLRDEAFVPLNIDDEIYIGVPESVPNERIARLDAMSGLEPLWPTGSFPDGFMSNLLLRPNSYTGRAFRNPQLSPMPSPMDYDRRDVQETEIPAANGVATARAVATMYMAAERVINNPQSSAADSNPLGLSEKALNRCLQPAKPGRYNGWIDEVLGVEACMGAGFLLPPPPASNNNNKEEEGGSSGTGVKTGTDGPGRFVAAPGGFGTPGAGGSFGYCDPKAEIAYAYVMNRCGQLIVDDPREFALRSKMYEVVHTLRQNEENKAVPLLNLEELQTPHYLAKRYVDAYPELAPL